MERGHRGRVDQFFSAKKRRYSKSDVLLPKLDIQVQEGIESQSPSKKSTLNYLVTSSHNGRSPLALQNSKQYQIPDVYPSEKKAKLEIQGQICSGEHPFQLRRCSQECSLPCSSKIKNKEG
eukprot:c32798_g1_i1 orf=169-531(+)